MKILSITSNGRYWYGLFGAVLLVAVTLGAQETGALSAKSLEDVRVITTAMDAARAGKPEDLMRLTGMARHADKWKPSKADLQLYHKYLETEDNGFVQNFAVTAVGKLKDPSSLKPLQTFIMTAQRRVNVLAAAAADGRRDEVRGKIRGEDAMLQMALMSAVSTIGEMDTDNSLSVALLGPMLKHDLPLEFGGAIAHSALARKGRPGLMKLLEESLTIKDNDDARLDYITSAVAEINNPDLVADLYTASLNRKYPARVRTGTVSAIGELQATVPEAAQLLQDIVMNETSDMRACAVGCIGRSGSVKGLDVLRQLRNNPKKCDADLAACIDETLLLYDTNNAIGAMVQRILSPTVPDAEKLKLCDVLASGSMDTAKVKLHAELIKECLKVVNATGEPLNRARVSIWTALFKATGVKHELKLAYDSDHQFEQDISYIASALERNLEKSHHYPFAQRQQMVLDETLKLVTKWVRPSEEKKP